MISSMVLLTVSMIVVSFMCVYFTLDLVRS